MSTCFFGARKSRTLAMIEHVDQAASSNIAYACWKASNTPARHAKAHNVGGRTGLACDTPLALKLVVGQRA